MSTVLLQLPKVKYCQTERPSQCPYCSGSTFQRSGGTAKSVRDPHLSQVLVADAPLSLLPLPSHLSPLSDRH